MDTMRGGLAPNIPDMGRDDLLAEACRLHAERHQVATEAAQVRRLMLGLEHRAEAAGNAASEALAASDTKASEAAKKRAADADPARRQFAAEAAAHRAMLHHLEHEERLTRSALRIVIVALGGADPAAESLS